MEEEREKERGGHWVKKVAFFMPFVHLGENFFHLIRSTNSGIAVKGAPQTIASPRFCLLFAVQNGFHNKTFLGMRVNSTINLVQRFMG